MEEKRGCGVDGDFIMCVWDDPEYAATDCNYAEKGIRRDDCEHWRPEAAAAHFSASVPDPHAEVERLAAENANLKAAVGGFTFSHSDAAVMEELGRVRAERDTLKAEASTAYARGMARAAEIAEGPGECGKCTGKIACRDCAAVAIRAEAAKGGNIPKCKTCEGQGTRWMGLESEVECSECEGTGENRAGCEWYVDNSAAQSYVTGCKGAHGGPPPGAFCQHCGRPIVIKEG